MGKALLAQTVLQNIQALFFDFFAGVIGQLSGRCTGARAVDKGEGEVKINVSNQLQGLLKVFFSFAWEANNKVRAD